jgi:hypothetical protein
MSFGFVYDTPDVELIPRIEIDNVHYFIGSHKNANAVYLEPVLVEKQIYNYNNPDVPLFGSFYLESGSYVGDRLTMLDYYGNGAGNCFLSPEYSTFYKKNEDFNSELLPNIIDYFTTNDLKYIYSLYFQYFYPENYDENFFLDDIYVPHVENAIIDINIEILVGRDSIYYRKWKDWQNARSDYFNNFRVNSLLDELQVTELTIYTYFEWSTTYREDYLGNNFRIWFKTKTISLIEFSLKFKKIGNYTNSNLLSIFGSSFYQDKNLLGLEILSKIVGSNNYSLILSKYRELDFVFDNPQSIRDDIDTLCVFGSVPIVYKFKFGVFLILPSYINEEKKQFKNKIGTTIDYAGNEVPIYEYFTSYQYFSNNDDYEIFSFYFRINPNFFYDYKEKLKPFYIVPGSEQFKSKCCLFDIFNKTKKI